MEQIKTAEKVRLIMDVKRYPVYKKAPFIIPIIEENGQFKTGQDLTNRQMMTVKTAKGQIIEPDPLTEEQKKKYPFVVDPSKQYKVRHLDWLTNTDSYQNAIKNLLLLSGRIAENKNIFDNNPVKYHGYLEDSIGEAVAKNNIRQERFDAESILRQAGIDDYKRIALIFSFTVPDVHIKANSSKDELFGQLIELCDTHPKQMKMCFHKYNPGIDRDIFILECIEAKILDRKDKGDIWYQNDYIGTTLKDVKMYLSRQNNEQLYAKFQALLDRKNGKTITSFIEEDNIRKDSLTYIMECKAAIFDNDIERARKAVIKISRADYKDEIDALNAKIDELVAKRKESQLSVEAERFKRDLETLPIDKIQAKITNHLSKYDEKACASFWDNKTKLIEYMMSVKYNK